MQPEKPKVFIGSSKESVELARAIQNNLDGDAWATVWDQGVIKLSQASWDGLIKGAWSSDFGIFVFSPDDLAQIRDQKVDVVRDNVILEFGLFTGRLGKERTFCVIPTNYAGDLHLPTDLMGITAARYQAWDPKAPASLQGILGAACNLIRNAMREAPPLPVVNYGQGSELTDIVEQINLVTRQSKEEILEVIKARLAGNISLGPAGLNDSIDQSISVDDEVERLVASGAYNQAEQLAKDRYDKQQNNVGVVEAYVGVLLRQDGIGKTKLAWQILKESKVTNIQVFANLALRSWHLKEYRQAVNVHRRTLELAQQHKDYLAIGKIKGTLAYFIAESDEREYEVLARQFAQESYDAAPSPAHLDTMGYVKITYGDLKEIQEGVNMCLSAHIQDDGANAAYYEKHHQKALRRIEELRGAPK